MTRPLTCLCLLGALGSGLFLYQTKHHAQLLDREITQVMKTADAARARTAVLQAEYQLLSDPQRLGDLAASHMHLRPTSPDQFSTWADLDRRLPPVGLKAAPDDAPLEAQMVADDDMPVPPIPPQSAPVAIALAQVPAVAPATAAAPAAAGAASVATAAVGLIKASGSMVAAAHVAAARPAPRIAALSTPTVTPVVSPVLAAASRSYAYTGAATQPPGFATGTQPAMSALGMARTVRLPSPMASAYAATPYGNAQ